MAEKMKIAIAQMDCVVGDVEANLAKIRSLTEKAHHLGCDIIVFPEMVDTGYSMKAIRKFASSWDGTTFKSIGRIAEEFKIHIICSISEREKSDIYNSIAVFDPKGELIGSYRKAHLADYPPLNEGSVISPGNALRTVEINGIKFGLMICYDLRFPEISRALALQGAEVLVLCSAWPFLRLNHWKILTEARAIENQVYFIAANRTGIDGSFVFCGSSRIIDPYGVIVSSAAEDREELICGEINLDILKNVRERMPIFKHRRTDLYSI